MAQMKGEDIKESEGCTAERKPAKDIESGVDIAYRRKSQQNERIENRKGENLGGISSKDQRKRSRTA